jgi:putative DNA methylase
MTVGAQSPKRKLIEVALPLEAINRESAREKSIRHGHPSTMHLWWARRPLAAARAVLFAQLVDDPSSHPDEFPTADLQRKERERLHKLIERLVLWDNASDQRLLSEAHEEILKSTGGLPPSILDPFAGGGTIPLEAQRLGLDAHASDLNPVAVLINKALIEIPPKFRDQPPIFPGLERSEIRTWRAAQGLAADVRAYGAWMREKAESRIGHLYPTVDGSTVITTLWSRTVICPNPACSAEVPLLSSLDLSTKRGKEVWLRPVIDAGQVDFEIEHGVRRMEPNKRGQGAKFDCWVCGGAISPNQVHAQIDVPTKPPQRMLAIVTAGDRKRIYAKPTPAQRGAADVTAAADIRATDTALNAAARGTFGGNAQGRRYGFFSFADYFTDRQLVAMITFSDLVREARDRVVADGGTADYADAVATYLGFSVSKVVARNNTMCAWESGMDRLRGSFQRQAIPMTWDFAEANPLSAAGGGFTAVVQSEAEVLDALVGHPPGEATQADAAGLSYEGYVISTDPPYYDNIVYSDLSDFFYVWLRRSLRPIYPSLLSTVLVPKAEELVANPYRHADKDGAKKFFEDGFQAVFASARQSASPNYPITVYYAFKQTESDVQGTASTGWETLLEAMISAGWTITSTWPNRSELATRMIGSGRNALASSIVLSLRPRADDATRTDRRTFITVLESELPEALRKLQQGQIAPVDLPQAAIGPGMAVYSRYQAVLEPDGSKMSVRSALVRINEILDHVLNQQEGDFDSTSRFALAWYRQHGYGAGKFGDADSLARARNTSVDLMAREEVLTSRAGTVQLTKPTDLSLDYDIGKDAHTSNWEALHHLIKVLEHEGIGPAGVFLRAAVNRPDAAVDPDLVKELAHLLFRIAEGQGSTKDALSFNTLVTSWPEIWDATNASEPLATDSQSMFEYGVDES